MEAWLIYYKLFATMQIWNRVPFPSWSKQQKPPHPQTMKFPHIEQLHHAGPMEKTYPVKVVLG